MEPALLAGRSVPPLPGLTVLSPLLLAVRLSASPSNKAAVEKLASPSVPAALSKRALSSARPTRSFVKLHFCLSALSSSCTVSCPGFGGGLAVLIGPAASFHTVQFRSKACSTLYGARFCAWYAWDRL